MKKETLSKNLSITDIGRLSMDDSMRYKNKFLEFEFLNEKVLVLRYFLNPFTRYSKFKSVVTKKIKQLYKENYIYTNSIALVKEESINHIRCYYYELGV